MYALADGLNKKRRAELDEKGFKAIFLDLNPSPVDLYVFLTSASLLPVSIAIWCVITALSVVPFILGKIYLSTQTRPLNRVEGWGFRLYLTLISPFAAIIGIITFVWFFITLGLSYVFGLPIALLRCVFQGPGVIRNNFKLLAPHWHWGASNYPDAIRGHLGQADRHGFVSFLIGSPLLGGFASSLCHVGILKYFWTTNPFFYELEEVFINQWTPAITDLTPLQVRHKTQTKVGRSKHRVAFAQELDSERFTPHYPFGSSNGVDDASTTVERDTVVGSQYLNCHPKLYGHTRTVWAHAKDKMRDNDGLVPIFRVHLDYFGFHFLTGYVELNASRPTDETEAAAGFSTLSHPMWLVLPKRGMLARGMGSFVSLLFLAYMQEALYATEVLVDDDDRDVMMRDLAKRKSMYPEDRQPQRRRSSLSRVVQKVEDALVPSALKDALSTNDTPKA